MHDVLAIHWSPTTHGTWLHGDKRGSWKNGHLIDANPWLEARAAARMSHDAVVLSQAERLLVAEVFGTTAREQSHQIFAATVQATHSHLILAPPYEEIGKVVARLKYRSAAAVLKLRRQNDGECLPRSLWTGGKFLTLITSWSHLRNAILYVERHNEREGLPPKPFDWIAASPDPEGRANSRTVPVR